MHVHRLEQNARCLPVHERLMLVACTQRSPQVAGLVVALLERSDLLDAHRVVVQSQQRMHCAARPGAESGGAESGAEDPSVSVSTLALLPVL